MRLVLVDDDDPFEEMSVAELRRLVRAGRKTKDGIICLGCDQLAKDYPRRIHKTMAKALIDYYRFERSNPGEYLHVTQSSSHETSQLHWWGLLEEKLKKRGDGGRAGYWRITPKGKAFVTGMITIPKHAVVYDHVVLRLEGPQVTLSDCLERPFDLRELFQ